MSLEELLLQERERYVSFLKQGFEVAKAKYQSPTTELLIQYNDENVKSLHEVFQLFRCDLIYKDDEGEIKILEYNLDSLLHYPDEDFMMGQMKISISPFVWHGCEITINKSIIDWNEFYAWATRWLDVSEILKSDEEDILGVIHNVTTPLQVENNWEISIDLGTAPIYAIKELFMLFESQGISELSIDSNSFS